MALDLIEGWTERIGYQVYADGTAPDLTAATVTLVAWNPRTDSLTMAGSAGLIGDGSTGQVYFDPDETDLTEARTPIFARFKIVDGSSKVSYFPTGDPLRWDISKP
jgi:hypothetical protein